MSNPIKKEFIGALGKTNYDLVFGTDFSTILMLRGAFLKKYDNKYNFNVCSFHNHKSYDYTSFAGWVRAYHCSDDITAEIDRVLKMYCVNYFVCPEVEDVLELEAITRVVFPELDKPDEVKEEKKKWWQRKNK